MIARTVGALLLSLASLTCSASVTSPGRLAELKGFHTCRNAVEDLAKFLTKDSKFQAAFVSTDHFNPDAHLFNAIVPTVSSDGSVMVSIMNVAPAKAGACDSSYTNVVIGTTSCEKLQQALPSDWKAWGKISGGGVVLKNALSSVVLVPEGDACLVLKTGVQYGVPRNPQTPPQDAHRP